jgi:hypothetical protein
MAELAELLELGPRLHELLAPRTSPVTRVGRDLAVLTVLSGRLELWEVNSVATSFASHVHDGNAAAVLSSLAHLAEQGHQWPEPLADVASQLEERSGTDVLRGFADWAGGQRTDGLVTLTDGLLQAAKAIDLAFAAETVRALARNLEVCVERCRDQPPFCLLACLEGS